MRVDETITNLEQNKKEIEKKEQKVKLLTK